MKTPTHDEVAQYAYQLWQGYGSPSGRDLDIWLEAERQIAGTAQNSNSGPREVLRRIGEAEAQQDAAFARRVKSETAAESTVEFNISPPIPEEAAIKAALQEKQGREPKFPTKTAPKAPPPESGKPIWRQPHSS